MRFNKKDYEKAEQFFNGETKWRDTWAEQSPSKDYETFAKRAGELMKAGVEEGVEQTKKKRTFLDDGDDWETFQKIEEQQKFVKMSVADWGKVRKLLLEAAEDDLILTKYSDKHVLPPFRAWDIANLLCEIQVLDVEESNEATITNDGAWGRCGHCDYEFNSELRNEYGILYCPACGTKILEVEECDG